MRFAAQPIGRDPRDRRTQYQRGADFERKVRDHLMHDLDACYVVRSAGSRGIIDLVAFFPADISGMGDYEVEVPNVRLVQCKRDGRLSDEDRELLTSLAAETGTSAWLAWSDPDVGVKMEEVSANESAPATEIRSVHPHGDKTVRLDG